MKTTLLALGLLIVISMPTYAFDGERKGLVIDVGVGPGLISMQGEDNAFGFMTDMEIGYAFNDRLIFHLINKAAWYRAKWYYYDWSQSWERIELKYNNWTTVHGLIGLGGTYFLQPQAPSAFLTAGTGLAYTTAVGKKTDNYAGFGILLGGGYEFARHWAVSGHFMYARPGKVAYRYNLVIIRITANLLIY
jgi:hypothetical protein